MCTRHVILDLPASGMRAVTYWGVYTEFQRQSIIIDRIYGRSSGAIVGACMICFEVEDFEKIYKSVRNHNKTKYIVNSWCLALQEHLPTNAFELCTEHLFVTAAILGCIPCTISKFKSNKHLIQALYDSSNVPFVTTKLWGMSSRYILPAFDGALIDYLYPNRYKNLFEKLRTYNQAQYVHVTLLIGFWPERFATSATKYTDETIQDYVEFGRERTCASLMESVIQNIIIG